MTNPDTPDQVKVEQLAERLYTAWAESDNIAARWSYLPWSDINAIGKLRWRTIASQVAGEASLTPPANSTGLLREAREFISGNFAKGPPDSRTNAGKVIDRIDTHLANQSDSTGEKGGPSTEAIIETYWQMHKTAKELGYPSILEALEAAPVAGSPVDGVREANDFQLEARVWKRSPYPGCPEGEWVLTIQGEINDTYLSCNHTEPLTTSPEDVPGLPSLYSMPATPTAPVDEGLVNRVKDELRGEPGEEYTDAGMEEAFFRWPIVEKAILSALSRRTTAESLIAGLRNYAREELGLISHSKAHRLVTDAADAIEEISATRLAALKDQG